MMVKDELEKWRGLCKRNSQDICARVGVISLITLHEAQRLYDNYGNYEAHPNLSLSNSNGKLCVVTCHSVSS